jgi:hypothetical protein
MKFNKAIPILESTDVTASITYFMEALHFENSWIWGKEEDFGGIVRDNVELFFEKSINPILPQTFAIVLDNVDEFYKSIKNGKAKILSTPQTMEWNMREMWIECPDGHKLHNTDCD